VRLRNWTPRYAESKLLLKLFQIRYPDAPWLTQQMVEILAGWLRPTDIGLEWGSGRSTLWFSRRLAQLTSVENNPGWHAKVQSMLRENNIANATLHLRATEQEYVGIAEDFAPASLDFALVDGGVARHLCALRAIPILKPGGLLVVDNINWFLESPSRSPGSRKPGDHSRPEFALWDQFRRQVSSWRHVWTTNRVTDTAMWVKPGAKDL
jgi:predicted O-methyltransferase YrrM